jgi:hypothetical protein
VHDSPGFKVGDDLLDQVANLIDLGVEFLLPVQEITVDVLSDGSDHVVADVSFVSDPVARIERQKNTGFTETIRVMSTSIDGIGDPCKRSSQGAGELYFHAGGPVFTGIQLRMRGPRPAWKQRAVHDVLNLFVKLVSRGNILLEHPAEQRCDPRNRAAKES